MPLTYGSLFAGVGGFDQGFDRAGMECRWQVEWDKNCQKLLAAKWPKAKHHGDITKIRARDLERVDVVCGGSPCQDLSVAGNRAGMAGGRSGLFHDMVRICKCQRQRGGARAVVWENVDGAFSSNEGRDFAAVLRAFTGLAVEVPPDGWGRAGFIKTPFPAWRWNCAWRLVDAQFFGVPQRRRRVFLVASAGDGRCAEILFEPESLRGDSPPSRESGQRVTGSISARTEGGGGLGTDFEIGGGFNQSVAKSLKASDGGIDREDGHTLIPETVGALTDGAHNGGGSTAKMLTVDESLPSVSLCLNAGAMGRQDSETETLIAMRRGGFFDDAQPFTIHGTDKTANVATPSDIAGSLRTKPPGSTENSSTTVILDASPVAFDTTQITSKENRSNPQPGDPCHPLASQAHTPAIAFSGRNRGAEPKVNRPERPPHAIEEATGALDATKQWNVAFKPSHFTRGKDGAPSEIHPPLSADADKGDQDPLIFQTRVARNGRGAPDSLAPALNGTNAGDTSDMRPCVLTPMAVRRLTPKECERLMGWPDDHTVGFADSVRYKMCGNGVVASCSEWIAKRIVRFLA